MAPRPSCPRPQPAIHASGRALTYTSALASTSLRAEIAAHYDRWYAVDVDPARVAVTTGSSGGFVLAFLAAFDPGDRVALARPGYPAYRNILTALGCEVVEIACGAGHALPADPGAARRGDAPTDRSPDSSWPRRRIPLARWSIGPS